MSDLQNIQILDYEEYLAELRTENMARLYANIPGQESTYEEILVALKATNEYNAKLYERTDALLEYNDEIVDIVELDEDETMDISVAGDQLFYANGVLTKNSAGLVHTTDFMLGIIETEELAQQGLQLIKQLKSRYGDKMINNKFTLAVKKGNQRWIEPDGETAPKIPAASDHEMEISNAAQNTQEHLNKVHRVQAASRSELEDLADQIKF